MSPGADMATVEELLDQAAAVEESPTKTALLEEAVRLADCANDEDLAYRARMNLIHAATFGGQADRAIVAYAWCLAVADQRPEDFDWLELLWRYKWIVNNAKDYPGIPRAQIEAMLDDLRRRYEAYGQTDQPYLEVKLRLYKGLGELHLATEAARRANKLGRDFLSDCQACALDARADLLVKRGRHREAIKQAVSLLSRKLSCSHVPEGTIPFLLLSFVLTDQAEEAERLHRLNYRKIRRKLQFASSIASHLEYASFTGGYRQANQMLETELGPMLAQASPADRLEFLRAALFSIERQQRAGRQKVRLRLPRAFPLFHEDGYYDLEPLACWFRDQAAELAAAFDRRNGNGFYTAHLQALAARHRQADRCAAAKLETGTS